MSQITVIAKLAAQPGKRSDLIEALKTSFDTVMNEPGTLTYILHEDVRDENLVWFYEVYADQDAVDAHRRSDDMKALGKAIGPYAAGGPEVTYLTVVGGKGL